MSFPFPDPQDDFRVVLEDSQGQCQPAIRPCFPYSYQEVRKNGEIKVDI